VSYAPHSIVSLCFRSIFINGSTQHDKEVSIMNTHLVLSKIRALRDIFKAPITMEQYVGWQAYLAHLPPIVALSRRENHTNHPTEDQLMMTWLRIGCSATFRQVFRPKIVNHPAVVRNNP
jgi:hypothetical protein